MLSAAMILGAPDFTDISPWKTESRSSIIPGGKATGIQATRSLVAKSKVRTSNSGTFF